MSYDRGEPETPVEQRSIVIGTRASKLALVQTELARTALLAAYPGLSVTIQHVTTKGDGPSFSGEFLQERSAPLLK